MPNLRQNRRTGRFKRNVISGAVEKEYYAREFYSKHKRQVDNALRQAEANGLIRVPNGDYEKVFTSIIKASPRTFTSKEIAKRTVAKELYRLQGGDPDVFDAKHAGNRGEYGFSDLRKLNKRLDGQYQDWNYKDPSGDWETDGYYEIANSDVVIAKVIHYESGSPIEMWEYINKDEIGIQ